MERPRSFKNLAPRTTGSCKPPTPTTATTSVASTTLPAPIAPAPAVPTTVLAPAKPTTAPASAKPTTASACAKLTIALPSEPRTTSSAKMTTTTAKESRLSSVTRTDLVIALPAPRLSDYDAKRAAKGKGHEGYNRKRLSDRDNDKASASSHFSTLAFSDDVVAPIDTKSSGEMMRQGLKFLALGNKVGHKLEAEVENFKKQVEDEKRRTENLCNAVDEVRAKRDTTFAQIDKKYKELINKAQEIATLKAEARKSAAEIRDSSCGCGGEGAVFCCYHEEARCLLMGLVNGHEPPKLEDELTSLTADVAEHGGDEEHFEQLIKSLHGLLHVLDSKVGGVSFRNGKFSLVGRVGAEVTKSRIEYVAAGAGTVRAPEEIRTDEDSQGPRIDALTEDPRLDDFFGETEAEGAPIAKVAPLGVDEETVP
ncbi:hypothetical protein AALP_AA4G019100 [Arabis alpina]|uniref:Uncharacterized protein n=1 Tax=Arabis alpina TaxID=50452 RepID=A0A087H0K0_ARAAL|nr:hypothetical protein AALP_AA4G019100 [Arabis alpina]